MTLTHGGDWAGFEARYGRPPLDFSASVSPLGVPEVVRRAMEKAISQSDRYPDPLCRELRSAIAAREGFCPEAVLCGGGAADLIFRVVLAVKPRRALITAPAFHEYEAALGLAGCEVRLHALRAEDSFDLERGFLDRIPGADMVFLCQPNNPTGRAVPRPLLEEALAKCREAGALLVVDECFLDLMDDPEACTMTGFLGKNLLILRSFTKLYALAGVRLGYCLGSPDLIEAMAAAGPPWTVSSLAQAAGLAALEEQDYVRRVRELVGTERPRLERALADLGFRVIPGAANFLLFRSPISLEKFLGERGILLRNCGDYRGLDPLWYRAAVRTREDDDTLISAIKEALSHV